MGWERQLLSYPSYRPRFTSGADFCALAIMRDGGRSAFRSNFEPRTSGVERSGLDIVRRLCVPCDGFATGFTIEAGNLNRQTNQRAAEPLFPKEFGECTSLSA